VWYKCLWLASSILKSHANKPSSLSYGNSRHRTVGSVGDADGRAGARTFCSMKMNASEAKKLQQGKIMNRTIVADDDDDDDDDDGWLLRQHSSALDLISTPSLSIEIVSPHSFIHSFIHSPPARISTPTPTQAHEKLGYGPLRRRARARGAAAAAAPGAAVGALLAADGHAGSSSRAPPPTAAAAAGGGGSHGQARCRQARCCQARWRSSNSGGNGPARGAVVARRGGARGAALQGTNETTT
jgi:hypothetical protein